MNSTNNVSARQTYEQAKRMFFRAFRDKFPDGAMGDQRCKQFVDSLKLGQSEIRLEVQLTATSNIFTFGVTNSQANTGNTVFNTENRLQLQDSLCVSEYSIQVGKPSSSTDTTWTPRTYANPNIFTTANVASALDGTFYSNGSFKLTCNNDVLVPYRGLMNHRYVPQTQGGVGITAQTIFPVDQFRGAEDSFITAEPNFVLVGSKNYQPQIILPGNLAAVETNQRAVLILRGVLAQNSTVVS